MRVRKARVVRVVGREVECGAGGHNGKVVCVGKK